MKFNKREEFFAIEVKEDDSQYLVSVIGDSKSGGTIIHGTTRNIHSFDVYRFDDLDKAKKMCGLITNDPFADKPRVVKVKIETSMEGV